MSIALWVVQGLLALMFLLAGGMKVLAFDRFQKQTQEQHPDRDLGLSKGFLMFIGGSELAGALGLVLPWGTGILPVLTPIAAIGLAVIMVGASRFHLKRQEPATVTIALTALCVVVAVGRSLT